jgi:hypothetical protein
MNKKIKVWQLADNLSVFSMPKRDWIIRWRDETTTPLGIGPRHDRDLLPCAPPCGMLRPGCGKFGKWRPKRILIGPLCTQPENKPRK